MHLDNLTKAKSAEFCLSNIKITRYENKSKIKMMKYFNYLSFKYKKTNLLSNLVRHL
jgi:hypothetical protein